MGILECFQDYPEELRPETPLKFQQILPISAQKRGDDVEELKEKLRIMLDLFYQESEVDEIAAVRDAKRSQKERAPRLV